MTLVQDIALGLLQLVALTIPPIAVLIKMLRRSENLAWRTRKLSFGLAIGSVVSFIATGAIVVLYLVSSTTLPLLLQVGLALAVVGLLPFALFTLVLYREHKESFR
ncbi:hypothetical protein [Haloprofundus salinisoli]|uniref:hypothetical protein n=1 Tax=Haloprofundus salinisoli TaxID=2876193 RepID=UPI00295E38A2|nr:hypothetical protein [Haloprofundus salinisoli]